ncbi:MAG: HPF/RaiA family ribosome-associated protein [Gloeobacteraceae cyanobacterium ES-bin-144]|nr:HPF/RaiA family ribosome-associated protein [Verrucomicrobiales bacterium]
MKLKVTHRNHAPSKSIVEMIEKQLTSLLPDLQIDEARVHLERSLTDSPPFKASFHLVAPGPDVIVSSSDHTLRAAILKAFDRIAEKIGHRRTKRDQHREIAPAIELTRRRPAGGQHS